MPSNRTFHKIGDLTSKDNPGWAEIRDHVAKLAFLTRELRMLLPEELSDHLVSVAMKPAAYRLVVFTDSAAWCTRLRYFAPVLSRRAEQLVGHQLQIRFLPIAVEVPPAEQPPPAIPADEINRMREMLKD